MDNSHGGGVDKARLPQAFLLWFCANTHFPFLPFCLLAWEAPTPWTSLTPVSDFLDWSYSRVEPGLGQEFINQWATGYQQTLHLSFPVLCLPLPPISKVSSPGLCAPCYKKLWGPCRDSPDQPDQIRGWPSTYSKSQQGSAETETKRAHYRTLPV